MPRGRLSARAGCVRATRSPFGVAAYSWPRLRFGGTAPRRVELRWMAKTEATTVDAGGREVRVSSPARVIFPPTEHSAAVTKLDVANYYVAVEDGIMRALRNRPTTL